MSSCLHVLPGLMGGVGTIVDNVVRFWPEASSLRPRVILTEARRVPDTRHTGLLGGMEPEWVRHSLPHENLYAALSRLAASMREDDRVVFSHDWYELATLMAHSTRATVFQVLHGDIDYYYDLARDYAEAIDAHVTYSRRVYDTLCSRLPARRERIFWIPYGVELPRVHRTPPTAAGAPLRLLFAGRLSHQQKGVFNLPIIARYLDDAGVACRWTVVGDGPDAQSLRRLWPDAGVRWLGAMPRSQVLRVMPEHDVFVLPTRYEGFPVALVEAMAAGLVPVVSDIPSGVPELVVPGENGFLPAVDDAEGFASSIAHLASQRELVELYSSRARELIFERHDIRSRVADYVSLCERAEELYQEKSLTRRVPVGSRLDKPWIPNWVVRAIRLSRQHYPTSVGETVESI